MEDQTDRRSCRFHQRREEDQKEEERCCTYPIRVEEGGYACLGCGESSSRHRRKARKERDGKAHNRRESVSAVGEGHRLPLDLPLGAWDLDCEGVCENMGAMERRKVQGDEQCDRGLEEDTDRRLGEHLVDLALRLLGCAPIRVKANAPLA